MFFAKALGGCLVAVFGGFYFMGFFDHEAGVLRAVETVREAEAADNARPDSAWGPQCDGLRDELLGFKNGEPVITDEPASGLAAIAKVNNAARELRKRGCDIDKAPGAFSPFAPADEQAPFREVKSQMQGDVVDGSEWGGDPNAFNEGGSDDWGR